MTDEIKNILGVFSNNQVTDHITGELIDCITYKSVREKITGKLCYLHLMKNKYGDYVVKSYVIVSESS